MYLSDVLIVMFFLNLREEGGERKVAGNQA